jgi:hypothetical protein
MFSLAHFGSDGGLRVKLLAYHMAMDAVNGATSSSATIQLGSACILRQMATPSVPGQTIHNLATSLIRSGGGDCRVGAVIQAILLHAFGLAPNR